MDRPAENLRIAATEYINLAMENAPTALQAIVQAWDDLARIVTPGET